MSNLTFSGLHSLQERIGNEQIVKTDLHKYSSILQKYTQAHQFDLELENKLNTLDSQERGTYQEKSSILNKQYAQYIEKAHDPIENENEFTSSETTIFMRNFKSQPIKFYLFLNTLLKVYDLDLSKDEHSLFENSLMMRLLTTEKDTISLNALELCTRDGGLTGLIEDIFEEIQHELKRQENIKVNSAIVDELESVKTMLDKKTLSLQKKEKDLIEAISDVQKQKSDLCNNVQQVYDILSRMMEDNYQNKLSQLNKRFTAMEHQLKQKVKMVETKGQLILKNNQQNIQDIQKLKQKNISLEKQIESQKLKLFELDKKLVQEKDSAVQTQKKMEKLQQKLQEYQQQSQQQSQQQQQQQQLQEIEKSPNIIVENKQQEKQKNEIVQNIQNPQNQQNQQNVQTGKYIKPFQILFEQLLNSINQIPQIVSIPNSQFSYTLLPSTMFENANDIMNNIIQITINRQGFQQLYQLMFSLSIYYFKMNNQKVTLSQIEETMKSNKKSPKYYINLNEAKGREFTLVLKSIQEKKKKNKFILGMLSLLYEQNVVQYNVIINEIGDNMKIIIESGIIEILVLRTIDDKNTIEILLELIQQGPHFQDIIQQLWQQKDILLTMLWHNDLEFCEKLSILLQRILHYNPYKIQGNIRTLIQKKISLGGQCELLKQNLNYILNIQN